MSKTVYLLFAQHEKAVTAHAALLARVRIALQDRGQSVAIEYA